jgi:hypothetical protein
MTQRQTTQHLAIAAAAAEQQQQSQSAKPGRQFERNCAPFDVYTLLSNCVTLPTAALRVGAGGTCGCCCCRCRGGCHESSPVLLLLISQQQFAKQ